jgi:type IV pilus assembly protein PilO
MNGSMKIVLTVVLAAVLGGGITFFVGGPLRRQTAADNAALEERRTQLVSLQQVAKKITCIQDEISRLQDALNFFDHRLPQEREIDVILRQVWQIAESKSLTPRSVRTTAPETLARYSSQPIMLSMEGSFEGFYEFLLGLEQMPRLTKVRQMQITKVPTDDNMVSADLLMDIFFEKQE